MCQAILTVALDVSMVQYRVSILIDGAVAMDKRDVRLPGRLSGAYR